jgi:cytochrome c-type biogenesis protein CcmH/NrfF
VMLLNDDGSVRANLIVTNVKCDTARGEQIREASSDLAHGIANLVNKYWSES